MANELLRIRALEDRVLQIGDDIDALRAEIRAANPTRYVGGEYVDRITAVSRSEDNHKQ